VGYAGGNRSNPTYDSLGDQSECVQVDYDPTVISYEQLVDLMFALHDPTSRPSYAQYASLILAQDDEQLTIARERAKVASVKLGKPLTTRIETLKRFWPAEDYHQKYYLRNDRTLLTQLRGMLGADETALRDSTAAMRVNGYVSGSGTRTRLAGEIDSFGLSAPAREHLLSLVDETASGGACPLP
jgi:methionine-S-sulfoxide reductase